MKTQTTPRILANCKIVKLREYSKSYGAPETIEVPFLLVFEKEIHLKKETGITYRVMRKGTRLLQSFTGTEISEKAFKLRTNKAKKLEEIENQKRDEAQRIADENRILNQNQIKSEIAYYFTDEKIEEIKEKLSHKNSKQTKNYLKMKSIQLTGTYHNWGIVSSFLD